MPEAKGPAGHDETDPHAWQNPSNVVRYVRNIAAGPAKVDPSGAAIYQTNAEGYVKELLALDTWAKEQFAAIWVPACMPMRYLLPTSRALPICK
jgi:zinc/manganese transport system substrate-binding protein